MIPLTDILRVSLWSAVVGAAFYSAARWAMS